MSFCFALGATIRTQSVTSTSHLLEGLGLSHRYGFGGHKIVAVDGVNISLSSGEAVGLVGESGSGKSTLGRLLAGLETPDDGEVRWQGETLAHRKWSAQRVKRVYRSGVQMVFQDPYGSLDPEQTAIQAVAEAVKVWNSKLSRREVESVASRLLRSVRISGEQMLRKPRDLSGGQRQRVSIARALAPNPKALIADEPTASIDQSAQVGVLSLLGGLRTAGLGILLISHDLRVIQDFTDRVFVMKSGRIVESGKTAIVFSNPTDPYTKELLNSIPKGWRDLGVLNNPSLRRYSSINGN